VSALINGRLGSFSGDRLLRCLTAPGQGVESSFAAGHDRAPGVG
jgi:hypothetical protein